MRINEIRPKEVNVTLDASELIKIRNIMYFYEKNFKIDESASKPNSLFHELASQIITAADLCQYGHIDSHSLGTILKHKLKSAPESYLASMVSINEDPKKYAKNKIKKLSGKEASVNEKGGI